MNQEYNGGEFDDYLRDEGLLHDAQEMAAKRVIVLQIARDMETRKLSKTEMASRMHTSRAALERLLDPANPSVTLSTLERAAAVPGRTLRVELT